MAEPSTALKCDTQVTKEGRIELVVPLPIGSRVTVFVVDRAENGYHDLLAAAESTTGFWDNPLDNEDWNDA